MEGRKDMKGLMVQLDNDYKKEYQTWIGQQEADLINKMALEFEKILMWGGSMSTWEQVKAREMLQVVIGKNKITNDEVTTLNKMIDSPAGDDVDLALAIMEQLLK